jgi:hypothetical protein
MTALQLAPMDSCMNILENYYIQFFHHNNMIINEQGKKNAIYNYTIHVPNIAPGTLLLTI